MRYEFHEEEDGHIIIKVWRDGYRTSDIHLRSRYEAIEFFSALSDFISTRKAA